MVLDAGLRAAPVDLADIAIPATWHAGALNATPDQITALNFTPAGRGLKPFAPAHARAAQAVAGSDIEVRWIRRDRAPAADNWALVVPMSEASEAYEIEVLSLDGTSVLRAVTGITTPAWTYPAPDQTADYGAAPVASLRLRIFQIGQIGRGVALERTLVVA